MYKVIYLYILKCSDNSYYIGVTNDLERRLSEHNLGLNSTAYTFNRRPVELVWDEKFTNFNLAFQWETKLKKWSRAKKEALIKGDYDSLIILSKKKIRKK